MPKEIWKNYERRWRVLSPRIEKVIRAAVDGLDDVEIYEGKDDENTWSAIVPRPDGNELAVTLTLLDAKDSSGDHEAGVRGALRLDMVEHGGIIVGGFCPYNYTKNLWVPYNNAAEFSTRLNLFENSTDEMSSAIWEWIEKSGEKPPADINFDVKE